MKTILDRHKIISIGKDPQPYSRQQIKGILRLVGWDYSYILKLLSKMNIVRARMEHKNKQKYTTSNGKSFVIRDRSFLNFSTVKESGYFGNNSFRLNLNNGAFQFFYKRPFGRIMITKKTKIDRLVELINKKYPISDENVKLVRKYLKGKCNFGALFLKEMASVNV